MRKRYYIFFVCRDAEGQIRKIPIPIHYLYVFLAGALIGMFTITGIAGSYTRMLAKVARFNQLRTEKEIITTRYNQLEQVAQEKDAQVASLGSLASEVSSLYGLKSDPILENAISGSLNHEQVSSSLDQLYALRSSALTGVTSIALSSPPVKNATTADWMRMAEAPNLWPVEGMVTGSFGERIDPFNGEGAFHSGIDISSSYGHPVIAPADGVVTMAEEVGGYGRLVQITHTHGISTRYGHLSGFAVVPGQRVQRGDVIGYVGLTGRSTGPHLHYEVRINNTPVNPYKYLRTTLAQSVVIAAGS
ncbi:MAG TPA: M23 family metallopeptidase [Terriglobales bacterium]|nr:M23 family metallopeptidase [Terriglobales bacterium]